MTSTRPAAVIVLAAGGGTRMRSSTPKVLHPIGGRTLLGHVLRAARESGPDHVVVVVRRDRDRVAAHVAEVDPDAIIADQDDIAGTGRATECGLGALPEGVTGTVIVTVADAPLLTADTLAELATRHAEVDGEITVVTASLDDPTGYGRILRDADGAVVGTVEERDATPEQRLGTEVNSGLYAFDAATLRDALHQVGTDNAQAEKYLTDVLGVVHAKGGRIRTHAIGDSWQTEGVNDRVQLARLGAELNRRVVERWMRAGVTVVDPATTWVDVDVALGRDVTIRPHTQILGASTIGDDVTLGPDTTLTDVEIGAGASVVRTQATLAVIGAGASVGPFAYLRPGTRLGADGKIGGFVETKNAVIGAGGKVPHLSYVGDADIGEGTNIGAGTIVANYDGVAKHRTSIGAHCRTGANNTFVAPVAVGDGAATGAGAVVRRDVPPGALAVTTGPQRHILDWVRRRRPGTAAARAAEQAQRTEQPTPGREQE
ncbi:MAG: bifunctional UDP-N-acetylglucosamine diphosphorylase/glucosamine-1-phosphate N-acetyltransferase GlmU [Nocardioidaceae bacterium]